MDRSPRGVEPTDYCHALLKRSLVAFDELKQRVRDIEFLADPTAGEVRLGCPESISAAMLPPFIERLSRVHPGLVLHVDQVNTPDMQFPELRERKLDVVARLSRSLTAEDFDDDLKAEILFNDRLLVVAGTQSPWARRRKVTLADLVNEPWVTAPPNTFYSHVLTEAF